MHALASEMAERAPGSEVVATRLAEVLLHSGTSSTYRIDTGTKQRLAAVRSSILKSVTALGAIHANVNTSWTVESIAAAAGMSRSGFAARFKELLGQTPLEYVTEWRMQKAMQLLDKRDKKLIEIARSVGYDSDAAFSKAFKRVVGANPSDFIRRGDVDPGNVESQAFLR